MARQGKFIINLPGISEYHSFSPTSLPPMEGLNIDSEMIKLLSEANRYIGRLEEKSSKIPDGDLFISMYIRKEALLSSQIEGTQATLDDIFDPHIEENLNQEVTDVINYIKALNYANERIQTLPISNRFLKEVHNILLDGLRGEEKNPGKFRTSQNWIGPKGSNLKTAIFVPPNVIDMKNAMSDLENFIHYDDSLDILIKVALIHYQFETIHPFLDGNGRIGRLMINLLLKDSKILTYDTLYISYFLKRNRAEYYDRLMAVRLKGHYEQWVKFFIRGIIESSTNALNCIDVLLDLHEKNYELVQNNTGRAKVTVLKVFNLLESSPIIDIRKTSDAIGVSFKSTANAVSLLVDLKILKQVDNKERNRVFAYEDYLSILREGTEL